MRLAGLEAHRIHGSLSVTLADGRGAAVQRRYLATYGHLPGGAVARTHPAPPAWVHHEGTV